MEISSKIIKRINLMYWLFFVVVVMWTTTCAMEVITGSTLGGMTEETNASHTQKFYCLESFKQGGGLTEIPVEYKNGFPVKAKIKAYIRKFDAVVELPKEENFREKESGFWFTIMNILRGTVLLAQIIIAVLLVAKFRKGVKTGELFSKQLIFFTRLFGFLMVIYYFVNAFRMYFDLESIRPLFKNSSLSVSGTLELDAYQLLSLFFVFFVAEILAVSKQIYDDQKMTI